MRDILKSSFFFTLVLFSSCSQDPVRDARTDINLQRAEGTSLRVISWNVNRDSFMKHPEKFRAIVAAADQDILLLDEVSGGSSAEAVVQALIGLRGAADTLWPPTGRCATASPTSAS